MNFWQKLKNWRNYVIGWLDGYSVEEVNMIEQIYREKVEEKEKQIDKWIGAFDGVVEERNALLNVNSEAKKCMDGLRTAQAEIAYPAGMAYDDIKRIARESIVRQLGEAVYPYAKHFLTSGGRYIVAVTVATEDGHGGK